MGMDKNTSTSRSRSRLTLLASLGLLLAPAGISRSQAPRPLALRPAAIAPPPAARATRSECSDIAVTLALAKARRELDALLPRADGDPAAVTAAMAADSRVADAVARTFASSDLVKSEYTRGGDCVVTVRLPLDRLRRLTRPR